MTEELRQVLEQIEQLDPAEQAAIAALLRRKLEEMADEKRWDELFSDPRSEALLDRMAAEARAEDTSGETEEGGWEL